MPNTDNNRKLPIGFRLQVLTATDRVIVAVAVVLYIGYLSFFILQKDYNHAFHSVLVPMVGFIAVGLMRKIIKSPRPVSELSDNKKSYGFPSRHAYSIFVISMTYLQTNLFMAVFVGILGILLSIIRVILRIHYPKDVIAGSIMGILCGFFGYLVLL